MKDPEMLNCAGEDCVRPNAAPILRICNATKAFGGVQALQDVSFEVPQGMILGIIGPNGAGKTTLFNLISGLYPPDAGRIFFNQEEIHRMPMHQRVRMGIARTFQNLALFENMSVLENVMVGQHVRTRCGFWGAIARTPGVRNEEAACRQTAQELLNMVGLADQAGKPSVDLPFGWQRLLEIARALASQPRVLLLDEPASGLNALETRSLGDLILAIRNQGVAIALVEHDMSLTMSVSDRIIVLDRGRILASGTPEEIQTHSAVRTAYLGDSRERR
jgi:branched-chain amino acid transport system ATP-binding protein